MARVFTADYSTGDFSQWQYVANKHIPANSPLSLGVAFPPRKFYAAQVISEDPDAGYVGRFEVRQGDKPHWGGQDRSEVSDATKSLALAGTTRWYAFSLKFDETFPTNHLDLGWGVVQQFHDDSPIGYSPPLAFGWPNLPSVENTPNGDVTEWRTGYWYLQHVIWPEPTTPGVIPSPTHIIPVFEMPINAGEWHDLKLQIKWSQGQDGFIKLWWNGQPQTLHGGTDTATGPTLPPNLGTAPEQTVKGAHVQIGYYRNDAVAVPGVVYNTGFRMADTENSL